MVMYLRNPNGQIIGIQGVPRNITERKKMREELIRLSNAVKMSTDSIVIGDINAKIIDVNEATLELYGTDDKGDLIGKNSFDIIAPEDREKAFVRRASIPVISWLRVGVQTGATWKVVRRMLSLYNWSIPGVCK